MSIRLAVVIAVSGSLMLSGCATAPLGTPGAGAGDTYTPFVDLHGVDSMRYQSDLAGCRSYAQQINPSEQAMKGLIGGLIVGAIVGGIVGGGNHRVTERGMAAGAAGGTLGAGGRAVQKQETIIANCLAGRGYRVLEGATVATNTSAPSPYLPAARVVAAPAVAHPLEAVQPQTAVITSTSFQASAPAAPRAPLGQDAYNAGKTAMAESCAPQPSPVLAAKGPGFESYTVACSNGDTLMLRCEFGNCRVLR